VLSIAHQRLAALEERIRHLQSFRQLAAKSRMGTARPAPREALCQINIRATSRIAVHGTARAFMDWRKRSHRLTSRDERVNMTRVVRLSSRSRVVSGTVALALALVSVATCIAGTLQLPEQSHAACHGMQTDGASAIGTRDQAPDCCEMQRAILGLGGAFGTLVAPPSTAAVVLSLSRLEAPPFESRVPMSSSPPTYILLSVFRI